MPKDVGWELLEYIISTLRINLQNKFRESSFSEDVVDIMCPPPIKAVRIQQLKEGKWTPK